MSEELINHVDSPTVEDSVSTNSLFHFPRFILQDCLKDWLKRKNRCPLCQQAGIARFIDGRDGHTVTISTIDTANHGEHGDEQQQTGDAPDNTTTDSSTVEQQPQQTGGTMGGNVAAQS